MGSGHCSSGGSCIFEMRVKPFFYGCTLHTGTKIQGERNGESPSVFSVHSIGLARNDSPLFISLNSKTMRAKKNHVKNVSIKDLISSPDPKQSLHEVIVSAPKSRSKSTSSKDDFFAQYKDPRWQKKRLQIMERDGFKCKSCQAEHIPLNVHHKVPYRANAKPWEYKDDELITICEDCHKKITEVRRECNEIVAKNTNIIEYSYDFLSVLCQLDKMNPYEIESVLRILKLITNQSWL